MTKAWRERLANFGLALIFLMAFLSFGALVSNSDSEELELGMLDSLDAQAHAHEEFQRHQNEVERAQEVQRLVHAAHEQGMREALAGLSPDDSAAFEHSCAAMWQAHTDLSIQRLSNIERTP